MGHPEVMEYLGLDIEIIESGDESQRGLKGKVYNETKNTFVIETKNGLKRVGKKGKKFMLMNEKEKIYVDGDKINYRPEERIKACWGN